MTRAERDEIRDQIDSLKDDINEIDANMVGYLEELAEIRERIAAAKAEKAVARVKLAELRAVLRPTVGA